MRLEPLYTVTFTTPEAWSVEVAADTGIEGRSFCWPRDAPQGASRPPTARPTSLGSGSTRRMERADHLLVVDLVCIKTGNS
jgi:hypothetical protein